LAKLSKISSRNNIPTRLPHLDAAEFSSVFRVFLPFTSVILSARQVCISKHLSGLLGASQRVTRKWKRCHPEFQRTLLERRTSTKRAADTFASAEVFLGKEDIY